MISKVQLRLRQRKDRGWQVCRESPWMEWNAQKGFSDPRKHNRKREEKNTINVAEQENVEPKDHAISQKRWKSRQGGAATKGKSKTLNSRHKDEWVSF